MAFHKNLRGLDLHAPSNELVENNTGSTLTKLKVVALDGMGTVFPQVQLANPNLYTNFAVVASDIENGKAGYVCALGFLLECNTSAWAPGTQLFSDITGTLSSTALNNPIGEVIKQDATNGILYIFGASAVNNGGPAWELDGNIGIAPTQFLGTTDASPIPIRTNNLPVGIVTAQGRLGWGTQTPARHVELKAHTDVNSSGLQIESFDVITNANSYQNVYVIMLQDPSLVSVELTIQGKDSVTEELCVFKRNGSFYRSGGNAQLMPQGWQSTYTSKMNNNFNITYSLGVSSVTIRVKAATSNTTNWVGCAILQELKL